MNTIAQTARANFERLGETPYLGRGLIMGRISADSFLQLYWISGRSQDSRNRVFVTDDDQLRTAPANPATLKNAHNIIYTAMQEFQGKYIVSNGDQTGTVVDEYRSRRNEIMPLYTALSSRTHEDDAPNYTPRITGVITPPGLYEICVLKHSPFGGCDREYFMYDQMEVGYGRGVTTYMSDAQQGSPLPSYEGEPLLYPLVGTPVQVLSEYWEKLSNENLVSMAAKAISISNRSSLTLVINKYKQVPREEEVIPA